MVVPPLCHRPILRLVADFVGCSPPHLEGVCSGWRTILRGYRCTLRVGRRSVSLQELVSLVDTLQSYSPMVRAAELTVRDGAKSEVFVHSEDAFQDWLLQLVWITPFPSLCKLTVNLERFTAYTMEYLEETLRPNNVPALKHLTLIVNLSLFQPRQWLWLRGVILSHRCLSDTTLSALSLQATGYHRHWITVIRSALRDGIDELDISWTLPSPPLQSCHIPEGMESREVPTIDWGPAGTWCMPPAALCRKLSLAFIGSFAATMVSEWYVSCFALVNLRMLHFSVQNCASQLPPNIPNNRRPGCGFTSPNHFDRE